MAALLSADRRHLSFFAPVVTSLPAVAFFMWLQPEAFRQCDRRWKHACTPISEEGSYDHIKSICNRVTSPAGAA